MAVYDGVTLKVQFLFIVIHNHMCCKMKLHLMALYI